MKLYMYIYTVSVFSWNLSVLNFWANDVFCTSQFEMTFFIFPFVCVRNIALDTIPLLQSMLRLHLYIHVRV